MESSIRSDLRQFLILSSSKTRDLSREMEADLLLLISAVGGYNYGHDINRLISNSYSHRRQFMRTANPVMSDRVFRTAHDSAYEQSNVMTVQGTGIKTGILLLLAITTAAFSWNALFNNPQIVPALVWGGVIGGLVFAMICFFKPTFSPIGAPLYAASEGLFLGAISGMFEGAFQGIVFQAVCLTFGTLFSMLMAYQSGWIKATENFKMGVFAATGGICLVYLVSFVMSFFVSGGIPYIHSNGWIGIGFSLFVVVIAALNLVLDFDFIEKGAQYGAPKYMEWYGALGLMVTLVWLYLEILRLLAKIQSRD